VLKEIVQMVINYKFKYFGKIIKNRNWSVITNNGTVAFFKHWNNNSCFHNDGKVALVKLRLKIQLNKGVKISEQTLITKNGIPSNPTHLEGLGRLVALLTSAAEIGAVGKKSEVTVSVGVTDRQDVLKIDSK
jgi:hypothetical protein